MLLTELFDTEKTKIVEIPPEDFADVGLADKKSSDFKYACLFKINDEIYLSYFVQPETFRSDSYAFSFASVDRDSSLHHEILNSKQPAAAVYSAVLSSLMYLIKKSGANTVVMTGHTDKQTRMYQLIAKKVGERFSDYDIDTKNLIIRRK